MAEEVGIEAEVRIVSLPPMRVARHAAFSANPEEEAAAAMARWLEQEGLGGGARRFGFDVEVPPERAGAGIRGYEVWRPVPQTAEPSQGITILEFEGGLYATQRLVRPFAPHADPWERIPAGWMHLRDWVAASRAYRPAEGQWLEEFLPGPNGDDLVLYHPVAPAGAPSADESVA